MSRPGLRCALALAVVLTAALPGCAVYRKCGLDGCPGDARITADVQARFARYAELQPPNLIYVQTLDHVVYLTGQVNTNFELLTAESVAREVAGVQRVVNSINLVYSSGR
jgi:osmotically-inducible protein OsmY